jgi:hypothetical protein
MAGDQRSHATFNRSRKRFGQRSMSQSEAQVNAGAPKHRDNQPRPSA